MATTTATSTVPTTTTRPIRPISSSPVPPNLYPSQALPIRTQSPSASPAAAAAAHHNQGFFTQWLLQAEASFPGPVGPPLPEANTQPNYNLAPSPLPPPIKGLPLSSTPEVAPSSVPDSNGFKDIRDKSRDDNLAVIRGRKVRMTDGASLYVHCRSWLRNGFPEECQPQYGDTVRSLPKPSPIPMASATLPKKEEGEQEKQGKKDDNEDEDEEYIQRSSPHDLLKRHVKRARKVRARLREERLQRIARYKSRLALLLPPLVEQFRNDLAAGN
ncbi:endochitinase A-like [Prunus yedoensis var. nudiflora]|uniref:Endochitinase A-like n=1 Tax=Prunus yedoensis var. nudiflora TaxID=2094558 RepID=A0A314ZQ39_PRUYE|nr:endochitinase A-like [Prunus yedoensis var. nudiflora]